MGVDKAGDCDPVGSVDDFCVAGIDDGAIDAILLPCIRMSPRRRSPMFGSTDMIVALRISVRAMFSSQKWMLKVSSLVRVRSPERDLRHLLAIGQFLSGKRDLVGAGADHHDLPLNRLRGIAVRQPSRNRVENDLRVLTRKQAKKVLAGTNERVGIVRIPRRNRIACATFLLRGLERGDWSGQCYPAKSV